MHRRSPYRIRLMAFLQKTIYTNNGRRRANIVAIPEYLRPRSPQQREILCSSFEKLSQTNKK